MIAAVWIGAWASVARAEDLVVWHAYKGAEERALEAVGEAWEARTGPLCKYCDFRLACPAQRPGAPVPGTPESDELLRTMGLVQRAPEPTSPQDLLDILDDEVLG